MAVQYSELKQLLGKSTVQSAVVDAFLLADSAKELIERWRIPTPKVLSLRTGICRSRVHLLVQVSPMLKSLVVVRKRSRPAFQYSDLAPTEQVSQVGGVLELNANADVRIEQPEDASVQTAELAPLEERESLGAAHSAVRIQSYKARILAGIDRVSSSGNRVTVKAVSRAADVLPVCVRSFMYSDADVRARIDSSN